MSTSVRHSLALSPRERNSDGRALSLPPENIFGHTKKVRYILRHIREVTDRTLSTKVMDFGCGNGSAVSQYVIASLPPSSFYFGVDMHTDSIAYANEHYARTNAVFLPLPPRDRIDVIVYADVLEHLDNPLEILRAHRSSINTGGIVVGSIPNGRGPFEIESAFDRRFGISNKIARMAGVVRGGTRPKVPYNIESGHLQFYRKRQFVHMLDDAGFRIIDFQNGAFFGAMVSERILRFGGQPLMRFNTTVTSVLPYWAASTWLFTAEAV